MSTRALMTHYLVNVPIILYTSSTATVLCTYLTVLKTVRVRVLVCYFIPFFVFSLSYRCTIVSPCPLALLSPCLSLVVLFLFLFKLFVFLFYFLVNMCLKIFIGYGCLLYLFLLLVHEIRKWIRCSWPMKQQLCQLCPFLVKHLLLLCASICGSCTAVTRSSLWSGLLKVKKRILTNT